MCATAVLSLVIGAAATAEAGVIQLVSALDLSAGGTTAAFTGANNTFVSEPYVLTAGGNTLSYTETNGNQFFRTAQGNVFLGDFPAATPLLVTADTGVFGNFGPVTIGFAVGVGETGMGAQDFGVGANTFTITAFNGSTPLGSFNVPGDGFVSFLGVRATGADVITSFTIANSPENAFALAAATFSAPVSVVPEPVTLTMLFSGGLAVLLRRGYARRRRTTNVGDGGR
jgi:hypothetical protein